jgi:hypothetical protein
MHSLFAGSCENTCTVEQGVLLLVFTLFISSCLFLCRVEKDYPPVARAGNDVVITLPENFVTLYGNGSTDDHVSHCSVLLEMGHSRKHPYHPHGGNRKLTPLPPSDVLIHLLLSETIFSPLPFPTAEISSVGGVWIFSGTTQCVVLCLC